MSTSISLFLHFSIPPRVTIFAQNKGKHVLACGSMLPDPPPPPLVLAYQSFGKHYKRPERPFLSWKGVLMITGDCCRKWSSLAHNLTLNYYSLLLLLWAPYRSSYRSQEKRKQLGKDIRPMPNVQLFIRRTKLCELSSWKVRCLLQLSSSEWVLSLCLRRIERLKIVSGKNVDLHMRRTELIHWKSVWYCVSSLIWEKIYQNYFLVWFSWLARRVLSSTSDSTNDLILT